jgi:hypothetical protein
MEVGELKPEFNRILAFSVACGRHVRLASGKSADARRLKVNHVGVSGCIGRTEKAGWGK